MQGIQSFGIGLAFSVLAWTSPPAWAELDRDPTDRPQGPKYSGIEAYGDSLTAGFLAYTDVTNPPPLKGVSAIVSDLARYLFSGDKQAIAHHHRPDLAWPNLLSRSLEISKVSNRAVSGAKVSALHGQVMSGLNSDGWTPDSPAIADRMAFFFIGHNDLCRNSDSPELITEHFVRHYTKALETWDRAHQGSTAYLMPVGDVYRVFQILQNYVWYSSGQHRYACEDSWTKFFPYCASHAGMLKDGTLRDYLVPRMRAINTAVARVAQQLTDATGRNNRFVYLDSVLTKPYEPGYFAVDCYHLSPLGQEQLARDVAHFVTSHSK